LIVRYEVDNITAIKFTFKQNSVIQFNSFLNFLSLFVQLCNERRSIIIVCVCRQIVTLVLMALYLQTQSICVVAIFISNTLITSNVRPWFKWTHSTPSMNRLILFIFLSNETLIGEMPVQSTSPRRADVMNVTHQRVPELPSRGSLYPQTSATE
jgi:hypothetical protein